ncbi:MAG: CHAT domain-containing protein [Trichodesmium sp. St16_bin4-tuft]|nr:CHAT domain-containing protein [Trichodesmium sp. St4_bin8_1]MDE5073943.1 CHAT domain-containing protein [Trichodesmium sp. St5_bin8]MDE5100684.1 CHAT domain-containing protein [Trichodesmium sp. St16_bin4-tuft]MDE5102535.1 CHAT domain-containing protein [Trichodesmium sp. St19_bin2]
MIIWKNLRLIISIVCLLIVPPSIIVDQKANINSQALTKPTKNEIYYISQNHLKTEIQKLEQQATEEFNNGKFEVALEKFKQVLEIYIQQSDRFGIIQTLDKIAVVYDAQGKYLKALEFYQKALEKTQQEKSSEDISAILSKIGLVYSQLGQYEEAIDFYQQSLNKNHPEKAIILNKIGTIYYHLKQFSKALEYYQRALEVNRKNKDNTGIAKTLDNIGVIYREQEKYSEALKYHQEALAIQEKNSNNYNNSATLHHIGLVYRELNKHSEALKFLTKTLIIERQLGHQDKERITLANIGKLLERKNQDQLAIIFYKQSINITENIRKDLKKLPVERQNLYIESILEIYRILADLLLQQKRALEAHQILDLQQVQEIFEYMGNLQTDEYEYSEVPLLESEKVFWEKYTQLIDEVDKSHKQNPNHLEEKLVKIQQFFDSEEVKSIISELEKNARSQKISSDIVLWLQSELKEHKQKNTVVLYPLLLENRLELVLVSANYPPFHRTVLVNEKEFNQTIFRLRGKLTNKNKSNQIVMQEGLKLYNWLIKPIEIHLKLIQVQTIIYAPDQKLRYIPLAALYDGKKWLVERFKVNNITAASLMDLEPRERFKPIILAGALTEGSYNFEVGKQKFEFESLPFAGVEVEEIEKIFPNTNKLLGNGFTKEAAESKMNSYNIVHFATHSAFITGHPEESFILFGDGALATLRDVENWNLQDVELVVLSACQTALVEQTANGQEILGFGYKIQEAGAAASIATLWRVDDQGTQEFMNDFYTALKNGESKTVALQKAQISMINSEYSHPSYWAPFILIGNGL